MRHLYITPVVVALTLTSQLSFAEYKVHEWGTFTSLVGSNGITQPGMYHEDEPLPDFVHPFGKVQRSIPTPTPPPSNGCAHCKVPAELPVLRQAKITQKMETPVIYFYSDQERKVDVHVKFPLGAVTETYPAPVSTSPTKVDRLINGDTLFQVTVLNRKTPSSLLGEYLPYVPYGNIYGHARNVDSNLINTATNELEKFIFYRGLGHFQPRLSITSKKGELTIEQCKTCDTVPALFLVHVKQNGESNIYPLGSLAAKNGKNVIPANVISDLKQHPMSNVFSTVHEESITLALQRAGLKYDEALAMVNTWENGYLKVPGLRLLYILPRSEVDHALPLEISPTPEELKRVFVGRIEVLLDTDEQDLVNRIVQNQCGDCARSLGRFAEPMLYRAKEAYVSSHSDLEDLAKFDELIEKASTGFGTAAVH
jgi:hypothetical protein